MEAADLVAASKLSSRRGYWAFLLLTVGFLALGIINLVIGVDPTGWAPPFVVGILMALYLLIGARLHVGRQARSLVGEDIVVRVDESGIHRDTTGSHQWSEWSALTGVSESLTSIVLRRDRLPAYFLPKRAFASQADVD